MENKYRKLIYAGTSVVIWLILWEIAAKSIDNTIFLPSVGATIKSLLLLLGKREFYRSIGYSLGNIVCGFLLGSLLGAAFAIFASLHEWIRSLLNLPIRVIKATPVASFTILALLWMNSARLSVLISCLMVIPIMYTNLLTGLEGLDRQLFEMADCYRMRPDRKLRYLYLPALLPSISAACTVGIGLAWKSGVAAEVIGITKKSIGNHLYQAKIFLEIPELFAWTLVTVGISILTEQLVRGLLMLVERAVDGRKYNENKKENSLPGKIAWNGKLVEPDSDLVKNKKMHKRIAETLGAEKKGFSLRHVAKKYGNRQVLADVSFDVKQGEPKALLGASGIGKTTILSLAAGLISPDAGTVERVGCTECAIVFQENRLCEELSVYRNLYMICRTKEQRRNIPYVLVAVGLAEEINRKAKELSGGMKRRVAIARALLSGYSILLLDEPFTGLDDETKQQIIALIREQGKEKAILLITHEEEDAERLGCHKIWMEGSEQGVKLF